MSSNRIPFWVVVGLEEEIYPNEELVVVYQGRQLRLLPGTKDLSPAIVIECDAPSWIPGPKPIFSLDDARRTVKQFLSSLAWARGTAIRETFHSAGTAVVRHGNSRPQDSLTLWKSMIESAFVPTNDKQKLALALYREALGVNSIPYKFLGFFKILNILDEKGKAQEMRIKGVLPQLSDPQVKRRITELQTGNCDVANHLYEDGRCAVAHAFAQPVVNPDNQEDTGRLAADLPLIRAVAEYLMEKELLIPRA